MADVLEGKYQDAIRYTLGLTEDELPNAEIDSPYVLPYVEAVMVRMLPSWESLDDDEATAFQRATMLRVATAILPRLRLKLMQYESDNKTIMQRWGFMQWEEFEKSIWGQYAEAVNSISALAVPVRDLIIASAPDVDQITGE